MLFLALSRPAIFSLFQSLYLADISYGIKKGPMSYRLSSEILLVSSLVWPFGPILWWCILKYGCTSLQYLVLCTDTWRRSLCPSHGLWPWDFCIWWFFLFVSLFFTTPRLILVHHLAQPLRVQEILATFSVSLWNE